MPNNFNFNTLDLIRKLLCDSLAQTPKQKKYYYYFPDQYPVGIMGNKKTKADKETKDSTPNITQAYESNSLTVPFPTSLTSALTWNLNSTSTTTNWTNIDSENLVTNVQKYNTPANQYNAIITPLSEEVQSIIQAESAEKERLQEIQTKISEQQKRWRVNSTSLYDILSELNLNTEEVYQAFGVKRNANDQTASFVYNTIIRYFIVEENWRGGAVEPNVNDSKQPVEITAPTFRQASIQAGKLGLNPRGGQQFVWLTPGLTPAQRVQYDIKPVYEYLIGTSNQQEEYEKSKATYEEYKEGGLTPPGDLYAFIKNYGTADTYFNKQKYLIDSLLEKWEYEETIKLQEQLTLKSLSGATFTLNFNNLTSVGINPMDIQLKLKDDNKSFRSISHGQVAYETFYMGLFVGTLIIGWRGARPTNKTEEDENRTKMQTILETLKANPSHQKAIDAFEFNHTFEFDVVGDGDPEKEEIIQTIFIHGLNKGIRQMSETEQTQAAFMDGATHGHGIGNRLAFSKAKTPIQRGSSALRSQQELGNLKDKLPNPVVEKRIQDYQKINQKILQNKVSQNTNSSNLQGALQELSEALEQKNVLYFAKPLEEKSIHDALVKVAYYYAKEKIIDFEQFILKLREHKLMKKLADLDLEDPEVRAKLKEIQQEGLERFKKSPEDFEEVAKKLTIEEVKKGVVKDGITYFPESDLYSNGKHGINWTEGPARLINEGKNQGQFKTLEDIHDAVKRASLLKLGEEDVVQDWSNNSIVWIMNENGNIISTKATRLYIKVYPSGKVHAFPGLDDLILNQK